MHHHSHRPWNQGRSVGPRLALTPTEAQRLHRHLRKSGVLHDHCLFLVGIDTMLRASDLIKLRVSDVAQPNGTIKTCFPWRQTKTRMGVFPTLTTQTQKVLKQWIEHSGKQSRHYLFTRTKPNDAAPISIGFYRTLIKSWVRAIGLNAKDYSAHSLRRTKAVFLYKQGVSVEIIGRLLGHRSSASTIVYLGIDTAQAHQAALDHDIFNASKQSKSLPDKGSLSDFDIEKIATKIVQKLNQKTKGI